MSRWQTQSDTGSIKLVILVLSQRQPFYHFFDQSFKFLSFLNRWETQIPNKSGFTNAAIQHTRSEENNEIIK